MATRYSSPLRSSRSFIRDESLLSPANSASPRSVNSPLLDAYSHSDQDKKGLALSDYFDERGPAREDSINLILKDRPRTRPNVQIVIGADSSEFDVVLDTKRVCDLTSHSTPSSSQLETETELSTSDDDSEDRSYSVVASYSDDDDSSIPPPPPPLPSELIEDNSPTPSHFLSGDRARRQLEDVTPLLPIPSLQKRVRFKARVNFEAYDMDLDERKATMFFAPEERIAMRADWDASVTELMTITRKKMLNTLPGSSEGTKDDISGDFRGLEHWMSPLHWHRWKRRRAMVLGAVLNEQAEQKSLEALEPGFQAQTPASQPGPPPTSNDEKDGVSSSPTPDDQIEERSVFDYDFILCAGSAAEVPVLPCSRSDSFTAKSRQETMASQEAPKRKLLHVTGSIPHHDDAARDRLADASKVWSNRDRLTALKVAKEDRIRVKRDELADWNSSFSLLEI